jgi:hypothetical protein
MFRSPLPGLGKFPDARSSAGAREMLRIFAKKKKKRKVAVISGCYRCARGKIVVQREDQLCSDYDFVVLSAIL